MHENVQEAAPKGETSDRPLSAISLADFSDLIGSCYQGPLEESPWGGFLERFRVELDARYATLVLRPPTLSAAGLMISSGAGVSEKVTASYNESYFSLDPFVDLPANRVVTVTEIVGTDAWRRSAYFQQFLEPLGIDHILGVDIHTDEGIHCRLRVCRSAGQSDFSDRDRALCALVLPHLRRSVSLHSRLSTLESERRLYVGTMDRLLIGTVILDETGEVLRMNRVAEEILSEHDGLVFADGTLTAEHGPENKNLRLLVGKILEDFRKQSLLMVEALSVTRPSGRAKLEVLIRPVPPAEWGEGQRCPAAALFIRDPERRGQVAYERIVRQLFNLTPAETALALMMSNGLSLDEAAEKLNIRRNTARAHLRTIFSKTGVTRQTELVRILLNSVIALG